jgi:hypothetical protein
VCGAQFAEIFRDGPTSGPCFGEQDDVRWRLEG